MKYWKAGLAIVAALSASLALAEDFKTVNGKEYKNATVSRVEPDGIVIRFSGGIVKIPFTELPKEVQERFHYNPEKAREFGDAAQVAAAQSNAAAAQQQQQQEEHQKVARQQKYRIQGYVEQKIKDGFIVKAPQWREIDAFMSHDTADLAAGIKLPEPLRVFLKGHPDQERLADGDQVDVIGYETGMYSDGGTTYHAFTFYSK